MKALLTLLIVVLFTGATFGVTIDFYGSVRILHADGRSGDPFDYAVLDWSSSLLGPASQLLENNEQFSDSNGTSLGSTAASQYTHIFASPDYLQIAGSGGLNV